MKFVLWLVASLSLTISFWAQGFVLEGSKTDPSMYKYWAQFYTGSDLVAEEINLLPPSSLRKLNIAVFDGEFDLRNLKKLSDAPVYGEKFLLSVPESAHANFVWHLISGFPQISGSSGPVNLAALGLAGDYKGVGRNLISQNTKLDLANVSHDNRPSYSSLEDKDSNLSDLLIKETRFVCSAGNYYPSPADDITEGPCIQVGSMSPEGFVSGFSMEGESVVILAPSDWEILSHDGIQEGNFGGTSGASPQVVAALANIMHFKKFNFYSYEDLKSLLIQTAIPIPQSKTLKNGAGFLNSYQLYRVARLLRFNKITTDNIDKAISKLYLEAELNLQRADKLVSSPQKWKSLRIAFHLGSKLVRKKAAIQLANLFESMQLYRTASFYNNFANNFSELSLEDLLRQNSLRQHSSIRFWLDTQNLTNKDIKSIYDRAKPYGKIAILSKFAAQSAEKDFLILNSTDPIPFGKITVGEFATYLLGRFY